MIHRLTKVIASLVNGEFDNNFVESIAKFMIDWTPVSINHHIFMIHDNDHNQIRIVY